MTTSVFRNSLNTFFQSQVQLQALSAPQRESFINEHITLSKNCALEAIKTVNLNIRKLGHDDIIANLKPQMDMVGFSAKIYAVFYACVIIVLSTLALTGNLPSSLYFKLICAASAINLFIQWATPFNNLRKLESKYKEPCTELSEIISDEITKKINELITISVKKLYTNTESLKGLTKKDNLIVLSSEKCQSIVYSEFFDDCINTDGFLAETQLDSPKIVGLPEYASVIHTLVVILFAVMALKGHLPSSLATKVILGSLPLGIVSSIMLQRTLDNRIVNPFNQQDLDPKDAEKIKQRLMAKINLICL